MVRGLPIQWDCSLRSTTTLSMGHAKDFGGQAHCPAHPTSRYCTSLCKVPHQLNGFCSYSTKSNLQWLLPRIMRLTGYPLQAQRNSICVGHSHIFKRHDRIHIIHTPKILPRPLRLLQRCITRMARLEPASVPRAKQEFARR